MRTLAFGRYAVSIGAAALLAACGAVRQGNMPPVGAPAPVSGSALHATTSCPCLYVANRNTSSVTVYPIGASGNVKPLQDIHGSKTGMRDPHDVALDASGNIYVANTGSSSVTVYAPGATGNTKPIETISGRKTQLAVPTGIAIDSVNGDIYALNNRTDSYGDGSVTIYPPGANGNVRPIGVISGPSTQLIYPNSIALDASGNIYVTNHNNYVTVYPTGGTGDVAPTRTIEGNLTKVLLPTQVALDSSLNVYVANYEGRSATVYGSDANGNTAPIQDIHGSRTKLGGPFGVAVDADGDIYVASVILSQKRGFQGRITAYSAASNGNVRPIRTIAGHHTRLEFPTGITIH